MFVQSFLDESKHRRRLELMQVRGSVFKQYASYFFGIAAYAAALMTGLYFMWFRNPEMGKDIIIYVSVAAATVFVTGRVVRIFGKNTDQTETPED